MPDLTWLHMSKDQIIIDEKLVTVALGNGQFING